MCIRECGRSPCQLTSIFYDAGAHTAGVQNTEPECSILSCEVDTSAYDGDVNSVSLINDYFEIWQKNPPNKIRTKFFMCTINKMIKSKIICFSHRSFRIVIILTG